MRIRVFIDVRGPLKKERKVKMHRGDWNVVQFKIPIRKTGSVLLPVWLARPQRLLL